MRTTVSVKLYSCIDREKEKLYYFKKNSSMKKIILILAICSAVIAGCSSSHEFSAKKETDVSPQFEGENSYFVATPKITADVNGTNIAFALKRTNVATVAIVTYTISYTNPSTGLVTNIDRVEEFRPGEFSKPIQVTTPPRTVVSLVLFEQDKRNVFWQRPVNGQNILRLI